MKRKTPLFVTVKKGTKPVSTKKETLPPADVAEVISSTLPVPIVPDVPEPTSEKTVTKSGLVITKKIRQPVAAVVETKSKPKREAKKHVRPPRPSRKPSESGEPSPVITTTTIQKNAKTKIVKKTRTVSKDDDDKESTTNEDDIGTDDVEETDDKEDENIENIEKAPNREDLMDKLEARKYILQKKIKKLKKHGLDTSKYEGMLEKVQRLLSEVKKVDAKLKVIIKKNERKEIIKSFKKKYKKLKKDEFSKKIDLTAPKVDREPEVGVSLWKKSKDVIYADKTYKTLPDKKKKQVLTQITRKKIIEPEVLAQIERKVDSNFKKINVELNHSNLLAYKKYDPLNYKGLTYY